MRSTVRLLACVAGALVGLAGCGEDDAVRTDPPLELTTGDACGDAFFWAATESGDVAVTVAVDARDRSHLEATTIGLALPDPGVEVEVLQGDDLPTNFCTDVIDGASEPRRRQDAVAGEGTITLDPLPDDPAAPCGSVGGEMALGGLESEDGRTFAPISVTSDSIGCYSG